MTLTDIAINVSRVEGIIKLAVDNKPTPAKPGRTVTPFHRQYASADLPIISVTRRMTMETTSELKQLLKAMRLSSLLTTLPERVAYAKGKAVENG